jgi:hypothetical protein
MPTALGATKYSRKLSRLTARCSRSPYFPDAIVTSSLSRRIHLGAKRVYQMDSSGQQLPRGQAFRRRTGMVVEYTACLVRAECPHPARPRSKRDRSHLLVSENAIFLLSAADDFILISDPFTCPQIQEIGVSIRHMRIGPKLIQLASKTVVGVRGSICVFKFVDFVQTVNCRRFVLGNAKIPIVKRWSKKKEKCKE